MARIDWLSGTRFGIIDARLPLYEVVRIAEQNAHEWVILERYVNGQNLHYAFRSNELRHILDLYERRYLDRTDEPVYGALESAEDILGLHEPLSSLVINAVPAPDVIDPGYSTLDQPSMERVIAYDAAGRPQTIGIIGDVAWDLSPHFRRLFGNDVAEIDDRSFSAPPVAANGDHPVDEPRSAYPLLRCPERVIAKREFEIEVGISKEQDPDTIGDPLVLPPISAGEYDLVVEVVAEGFRFRDDESPRQVLRVTVEQPYPAITLHLTPKHQRTDVRVRMIRAMYSIDGQPLGVAYRPVAVLRARAAPEKAPALAAPLTTSFQLPTTTTPADLTIQIYEGEQEGKLLWTFLTPHDARVTLPTPGLESRVGLGAASFARNLVDKVNVQEGKQTLALTLKGISRTIAEKIPAEFWPVLNAVADHVGDRPPTILILSQEPYVPWELASVEPPLDPSRPSFLAAQAVVGRWTLHKEDARPEIHPPTEIPFSTMAVISGKYEKFGWRRLLEAEAEASDLAARYAAQPVDAVSALVLGCLSGDPTAELLHFAVHGIYDPNSVQNGLVLIDNEVLGPTEVRGADLTSHPFVFLNACQVGNGNKILGDYAGMAHSFLAAGASAVIAPLWSVKDVIARKIALRFYEQTIEGGKSPAAVLYAERANFGTDGEQSPSATYLAYQFFGHPNARLLRTTHASDGSQ